MAWLQGAYSASKAALEAMSEGLRRELTPFGIDIVILKPGPRLFETHHMVYMHALRGGLPRLPMSYSLCVSSVDRAGPVRISVGALRPKQCCGFPLVF